MTREELITRIDALDAEYHRPETRWTALYESVRAQGEWARANPDAASLRGELCAQLEALDTAAAERQHAAALEVLSARRVAESGAGQRATDAARTPRETEALRHAREWLRSDAWCLVLAGDVGNGKTVAAVWALGEMAKRGSVEFRKAAGVTRLSSFGEDSADFERLKRVGLLVLDDLGAETLDDRGRGLLVELLDARYEARKRTIVTANPTWPQLQVRLGQRAADRLCDGSRVVELRGKSLRGAQ